MSLQPETMSRRRWQWGVMVPVGIAMALSLTGDLTLYAVLPAYASNLAINLATIGVLLSANRLIRLISNPVVGYLSGRFSRRSMMLVGLTTGALSTLFYVLAQNFWLFFLGRIVWGISWSLIYISAYCMILDITDDSDRGWGSGVLQAFYFVGLTVDPLLGGILSDALGFNQALLICAILSGAGILLAIFTLPETRPSLAKEPKESLALSFSETLAFTWRRLRQSLGQLGAAREVLGAERMAANLMYMLFLFVGDGIVMSTITLFLKEHYGDTIQFTGFVAAVAAVGGAMIALRAVISGAVAPLAGRWSDRTGRRWTVVTCGTLICCVGCVLLGLIVSPWMSIIGVVLAALGSGMVIAVLPAIVSRALDAQQTGLAVGIMTTAGDIGCAIAPLATYTLLDRLSLNLVYMASGALLFVGLIVAWLSLRQKQAVPVPQSE